MEVLGHINQWKSFVHKQGFANFAIFHYEIFNMTGYEKKHYSSICENICGKVMQKKLQITPIKYSKY